MASFNHLKRIYFFSISVTVSMLWIAASLLDVAVNQKSQLAKELDQRTVRYIDRHTPRKIFTDRYGILLADNHTKFHLWIDPFMFMKDPYVIDKLADIAVTTPEQILSKANMKHKRHVTIAKNIPLSSGDRHWLKHLKGVYCEDSIRRFYPQGEVLSQLLGVTDWNNNGVEGLELSLNDQVKSVQDRIRVIRDQKGRVIDTQSIEYEQPDKTKITLSIDMNLQQKVFDLVVSKMEEYQAESISVIVVDNQTGEVLVNVNYPSFDPNGPIEDYGIHHTNRIATEGFEPGSTIKPFVLYPLFVDKQVDSDTIIDTENGRKTINGTLIKDVGLPKKQLSVHDIIKRSSNVGIVNLALMSKTGALYDMYESLGFGAKTDVNFPGEKKGYLSYINFNNDLGKAFASMGYGFQITMLQLVQSYSTLANMGHYVPLTYLKRSEKPLSKRVLDEEVVNKIHLILTDVVKNGTGRRAAIDGFQISGKTGSSQSSDKHGYHEHYNASFAGYATDNDQAMRTAVVIIRNPDHEYELGSLSAAPLFSSVMEQVMQRYLETQSLDSYAN